MKNLKIKYLLIIIIFCTEILIIKADINTETFGYLSVESVYPEVEPIQSPSGIYFQNKKSINVPVTTSTNEGSVSINTSSSEIYLDLSKGRNIQNHSTKTPNENFGYNKRSNKFSEFFLGNNNYRTIENHTAFTHVLNDNPNLGGPGSPGGSDTGEEGDVSGHVGAPVGNNPFFLILLVLIYIFLKDINKP